MPNSFWTGALSAMVDSVMAESGASVVPSMSSSSVGSPVGADVSMAG